VVLYPEKLRFGWTKFRGAGHLVASLILNEWNILVEGASDKPIVEAIFFSHYPEFRQKVLVNGSLAESKDAFLASFYERAGLPYIVLLDSDSGGRDLSQILTSAGIPAEKIIMLNDVFKGRQNDFAIEDIVSPNFYHQAVLAAYPANPVDPPQPGNKKLSVLYAEAFKKIYNIGFNKRRVAESAKKLLSGKHEDDETRNNLGTLSTAIIAKLKGQASAHEDKKAAQA
jgi:5S rRNA maturation endonuclease (ribonuclease M5)